MDDKLINLGIGGVVIVLVIALLKIILPYLVKNRNGPSGEKPVEFWRTEMRDAARHAINNAVTPIVADLEAIRKAQEEIMRELIRHPSKRE